MGSYDQLIDAVRGFTISFLPVLQLSCFMLMMRTHSRTFKKRHARIFASLSLFSILKVKTIMAMIKACLLSPFAIFLLFSHENCTVHKSRLKKKLHVRSQRFCLSLNYTMFLIEEINA